MLGQAWVANMDTAPPSHFAMQRRVSRKESQSFYAAFHSDSLVLAGVELRVEADHQVITGEMRFLTDAEILREKAC